MSFFTLLHLESEFFTLTHLESEFFTLTHLECEFFTLLHLESEFFTLYIWRAPIAKFNCTTFHDNDLFFLPFFLDLLLASYHGVSFELLR